MEKIRHDKVVLWLFDSRKNVVSVPKDFDSLDDIEIKDNYNMAGDQKIGYIFAVTGHFDNGGRAEFKRWGFRKKEWKDMDIHDMSVRVFLRSFGLFDHESSYQHFDSESEPVAYFPEDSRWVYKKSDDAFDALNGVVRRVEGMSDPDDRKQFERHVEAIQDLLERLPTEAIAAMAKTNAKRS